MATELSNINTSTWSISVDDQGLVVEGLDDLTQCIRIILNTEIGSDPLRPTFGASIRQWLSSPTNQAVAGIKAEVLRALTLWEPRITVTNIRVVGLGEKYIFAIGWTPNQPGIQGSQETIISFNNL